MKRIALSLLLLLTSTFSLAQHTVTLSWIDTTPNITGYNVYRATVSGGPYTQIGNVPTIGYVDSSSAVQSEGSSFFYVVTAVDNANSESGYSNQAAAVIPHTPPPAPTGVTTTVK